MTTPQSIPPTASPVIAASHDRRGPHDRTQRVVEDLVAAGLVHPDRRTEVQAVVARTLGAATGTPGSARTRLVEVAGYLGGALVVASFGLFLADRWADLGDSGQVAALIVITLLLAGAGALVALIGGGYAAMRTGDDDARRRLSSALLTGAALAGAVTVGRVADLAGGDSFTAWPALLGGIAMVLFCIGAYYVAPSALVLLGLAGGALTAVYAGVDVTGNGDADTLAGVLVLALAVVWLVVTERGTFREASTARSLGVAMALLGAQTPLFTSEENLAYALTAGVAVAGFVLYLRVTSWPYLVVAVAAVTLVVPQAIVDWTEGSLGAGGAVLLVGLTLLGASAAGFRIRQEAQDTDR